MEAQRSSECLLPLFASGSSASEKKPLCFLAKSLLVEI